MTQLELHELDDLERAIARVRGLGPDAAMHVQAERHGIDAQQPGS